MVSPENTNYYTLANFKKNLKKSIRTILPDKKNSNEIILKNFFLKKPFKKIKLKKPAKSAVSKNINNSNNTDNNHKLSYFDSTSYKQNSSIKKNNLSQRLQSFKNIFNLKKVLNKISFPRQSDQSSYEKFIYKKFPSVDKMNRSDDIFSINQSEELSKNDQIKNYSKIQNSLQIDTPILNEYFSSIKVAVHKYFSNDSSPNKPINENFVRNSFQMKKLNKKTEKNSIPKSVLENENLGIKNFEIDVILMEKLFDVNISKKHLKKNDQSELVEKNDINQESHVHDNKMVPLNKQSFVTMNSSSISYFNNTICLKNLSGLFKSSVNSNDNQIYYSFKDNISFRSTNQKGEYEIVKICSKSEIDLSKLDYSNSYITKQNNSSDKKVTSFYILTC